MTVGTGKPTDRQLLTDFVTAKDEEAFAELVRRYGPMILGVCRQILQHTQDAEDTFQATFLLLARKASSIRNPEALPAWLYGVAVRLAIRNRTVVNRRRARESPLADMPASEPEGQELQGDVWRVLCEEIGRLPERYRVPFVLCYLHGKTNGQAARQLKCPPGTIYSRLARARELLRARLGRRGLTISSALLAATLATLPRDIFGAVSTELLEQTVRGAVLFTAKRVAGAAGVSSRVVKLAEQQIAIWSAVWLKTLVAALLSTALLGTGGGLVIWRTVGEKSIEARLKGTWKLQAITINGNALLPVPQSYLTYTGSGRNMKPTVASTWSFDYRIDPRTKPMQIYWTINGTTQPGIFDVQGDTLTMCLARTADNRPSMELPTSFTPGPENAVLVYARVRP